jgi:hypothetical protein
MFMTPPTVDVSQTGVHSSSTGRWWLQFGGVLYNCSVVMNSVALGRHIGQFEPFATISKQPSCRRSHGWITSTVNYVPAPPGPPKPPHPPPGPAPPPPPIPFGFAKALGNGMVLAAAPKQAMVWGFCAPGAAVEVSLDGVGKLMATVGPDQATGALTTWRVKLPASKASFTNHTITATSAGKTVTLSGALFGEVWVCSGRE